MLAVPSKLLRAEVVPVTLDHIIVGCSDLDRGIAFVQEKTGVRAVFGGVHPGGGTRNALLSLGALHYIEILAPDPKQEAPKRFAEILKMTEPHLVTWAVHPGDIAAFAKRLSDTGVAFGGPYEGSRARSDGRTLHWKSLHLADARSGLLPFFIEWSADSPHPSADAPSGCRLEDFRAASPDAEGLRQTYRRIGLDVLVEKGEKEELRARIAGPKGGFEITS